MSKSNNGEKTDMFTKKYDNNKDLYKIVCDFFYHVEVYISENSPLKPTCLKMPQKRGNTCILKDYSAQCISIISAEKKVD